MKIQKGVSVTFRRSFIDRQVRLGEVVRSGFDAVVVETGRRGTEETTILCVPLKYVCQVR